MKISTSIKQLARAVVQSVVPQQQQQPEKVRAELARDAFEAATPTPPSRAKALEADRAFVTDLYKKMLGREPDAEGMANHLAGLKNGMLRDEIVDVFRRSPEFQALQAAAQSPAVTGAPTGSVDAAGSVSPAGPGPTFGAKVSFTGFDDGKLAAPLKRDGAGVAQSAKYTFAKLAQASGTMPRTKAEAEAWFNHYIKPGMEKEGFQIDWVKGDKAFIRTRENPAGEAVDFVRGADSNDPNYTALAWQPEGGGGSVGGSGSVVGSGAVGGSGVADRDFVLAILSKYAATNEGIQRAVEELRRQPGYEHVTILQHPLRLDKLDFGGGHVVDVVVGAGGPNPSWGWMPE